MVPCGNGLDGGRGFIHSAGRPSTGGAGLQPRLCVTGRLPYARINAGRWARRMGRGGFIAEGRNNMMSEQSALYGGERAKKEEGRKGRRR